MKKEKSKKLVVTVHLGQATEVLTLESVTKYISGEF